MGKRFIDVFELYNTNFILENRVIQEKMEILGGKFSVLASQVSVYKRVLCSFSSRVSRISADRIILAIH